MSYFTRVSIKDISGNTIKIHEDHDGSKRLGVGAHLVNQEGRHVYISSQQELLTSQRKRLVGTDFNNSYYDYNFWTSGGTNGGLVSFSGQAELFSSVASGGTATLETAQRGRFIPGANNMFSGLARLVGLPTSGNTRRFGAYDDDNGFYFTMTGDTFAIGYRKDAIDTLIESGSFNGDLGTGVTMNENLQKLDIIYGQKSVIWSVNNWKLHSISTTQDKFVNDYDLPVRIENINSGSVIDNGIYMRIATIFRISDLNTSPIGKYIDANETNILKFGAGILHIISNCDNAGSITLYDNIEASGTVLAVIDTAKVLGTLEFGTKFSIGLTAVTTLGSKVVVIYE